MHEKISYRADIDGIRAIAVLAVVAFHFDEKWLPGGFVGVDIFFVVSGFLITSIIISNKNHGIFSFLDFYRRRMLRILPASSLVILASLIIGQLVMLPEDFMTLSYSALAAQLWSANIYFTFFMDTGYFADAAILNPLLHLWSLGAEEQFYFIWPAVLVLGLGMRRQKIFWAGVGGAIAASFIFGQLLAPGYPSFAYYMLPSRAGQFLAGAAISALLYQGLKPGGRHVALAASIAGLALVVWSLLYLDSASLYPGLNAVPPTVGAALLLWAGSCSKNIASAPLQLKPVRYVGLISYSLYLWHWPVLSFWWYLFGEPGLGAKAGLFALMLSLSVLTYFLVEQPFRSMKIGFRKVFWRIALVPASVVALIMALVLRTDGAGAYYYTDYMDQVARIKSSASGAYASPYVCQRHLVTEQMMTDPRCVVSPEKESRVLLWGDSNAAHYVGALREAADEFQFGFRNISHSSCPPVLENPERFVSSKTVENCLNSNKVIKNNILNYDKIMIAAAWSSYLKNPGFGEALAETIKYLSDNGKDVYVLGQIPRMHYFDRKCEIKRVKIPGLDCEFKSFSLKKDIDRFNAVIKSVSEKSGATYFDINDVICESGRCSGYLGGDGLYYDAAHWSIGGSVLIGKKARAQGQFPSVLSGLNKRREH